MCTSVGTFLHMSTFLHHDSEYINRLHRRSGHLWQNRFYSCALDEVHFWRCLCYVERNPVRTRLVRAACRYRWSSAPAHVDGADPTVPLEMSQFAPPPNATPVFARRAHVRCQGLPAPGREDLPLFLFRPEGGRNGCGIPRFRWSWFVLTLPPILSVAIPLRSMPKRLSMLTRCRTHRSARQ